MPTLIDSLPLIGKLRDALFVSATVTETEQLTPRIRRIRFGGPRLQGLAWTPGQHIRLQVVGLGAALLRLRLQDALRTYSIYDADPDAGTLDIAMLDHGGAPNAVTPASRWASAISIGDEAGLSRPQGTFVVREDAPYHVFVGEETASVAFAPMLRALPASAEIYGVVEGATKADHLVLPRLLSHVERGETSAANSATLIDAMHALQLPDRQGVAYLAGEARTIQAVRAHLTNGLGWNRRNVRTKPFWTPGRRGME